jgi:hypothetical protein
VRRPEQQLQIQVARYLTLALRPPTLWTAIGHGGGGKVRGAILKAMGMQPGWPDFLIFHPDFNEVCVLGVEMKSDVGSLSAPQRDVRDGFKAVNAIYLIARSVEMVQTYLRAYGIPLHAKLS